MEQNTCDKVRPNKVGAHDEMRAFRLKSLHITCSEDPSVSYVERKENKNSYS